MTAEQSIRYESLLNNISAAPSLEREATILECLLDEALNFIPDDKLDDYFTSIIGLESKAQKWADDQQQI